MGSLWWCVKGWSHTHTHTSFFTWQWHKMLDGNTSHIYNSISFAVNCWFQRDQMPMLTSHRPLWQFNLTNQLDECIQKEGKLLFPALPLLPCSVQSTTLLDWTHHTTLQVSRLNFPLYITHEFLPGWVPPKLSCSLPRVTPINPPWLFWGKHLS